MRNTVTRLKPRTTDFETAIKAFRIGDFSYCVEALSDSNSLSGLCLRARALQRVGRFAEALSALDHFPADLLPHAYAAELLAVKTAILAQMGDPAMEASLTEARARGYSSGFPAVECEVEFVASVASFMAGRTSEALHAIERVLKLSEDAPMFFGLQRSDYIFTSGYWRSRAYDIRGLIDAGREDYQAQAAALANAFVEFDRGDVQDSYNESRMLHNMAVLVRDIDSDVLASYVESRAEKIAWSPSMADHEFVVFQAIGWNRAKRGDHLGAFRHLRRSANVAPTIAGQIRAIVDRSFLANELGEVLSAQDDLDHALRLAKQVDWESASGTDRSALFALARRLAFVDTKSARSLWERYTSLKSGISLLELGAHGDRRQRADECSAHAAILLAEGHTRRAISLFLESFEIWESVGYMWRAAALAVDLAELTGESRYLTFANREAAKQPNSYLARRVSALKGEVIV